MKQYNGNTNLCGLGVDLDWTPGLTGGNSNPCGKPSSAKPSSGKPGKPSNGKPSHGGSGNPSGNGNG